MTVPVESMVPPTEAPVRRSLLRRVIRRPLGLLSAIFLAIIGFVAIFARWLAPHDPNFADIRNILASPSAEHLLGTDGAGRDVFSRLILATQVSIAAAIVALVVALVLGVASGLVAGYYQGLFRTVSDWVTSLMVALPGIIVLLAASSVLGPSLWIAMVIFGILIAPAFNRLVQATVAAVRSELYIDAAIVSGLSDTRIISRHILTVVRAPLIIQMAYVMGITIAVQSGLSFLGLGESATPTWGAMLNDAFAAMYQKPILLLWPSLAIALTCISLALLANAMRDELERTVPIRRRRRRAVADRSGAIAAVTTSLSTSAADLGDRDLPAERERSSVIVHPDDEYSSRLGSEKLLVVEGLTVGYDQPDGSAHEVVHGVDFDVRRGEVHGLIGESGSGKTQTAFAVLGLLSRGGHVAGGTIDYEGVALAGASDRVYDTVRGVRIGYVPQEPMTNLDPTFRVGSQLIEPLRVRLGMTTKDATAKVVELLTRVGIPDPQRTIRAYPFELSGGMVQRVLIAGAVSTDPDLIIADEPTTALDVTVQAEVLDLLRDLQRERGMAMLLVTHNFGVVADMCDRVTVMQNGRFVEQGPVRAIFKRASHPYTQTLLDAMLDEGPARPAFATSKGTGE